MRYLGGHRVSDRGFTLVEVLVAMSLFTVLVGVTLGVILRTTSLTAANNRRVVAASLGNKQIESARSQSATQIPDGAQTRTETVGGVTYTITQTANYLTPDATTSVCTGSGNQLAYKLVTVTVSWPGMGNVKPVRADTLRTIGVGQGLDAATGTLAVPVVNATNDPVAGVLVTLNTGQSVTTGIDGCAVVTGLAPGTYVATVSGSGFVDQLAQPTHDVPNLIVAAGTIRRSAIVSYDTGHTLDLTLPANAAGFSPPAGLAVSARSTATTLAPALGCALVATGQGCSTGVPGQLRNLYPDTWTIYAGTCADAAAAPLYVNLTAAGDDGTAKALPLGRVSVDVRKAGVSTAGYVVYAVHASDSALTSPGCPSGAVYPLPASVVGGSGVLLPYGTWTFSLSATPLNGSPSATLNGSSSPSVVVVAP